MDSQEQNGLVKSKTPEFSSLQEQENVAVFQQYIFEGGKLIKSGKFAQAIKHFRNKEEVQKAGLSFVPARQRLTDHVAPEDVENDANMVAMNSWFLADKKLITPSGVSINGRNLGDIPLEKMSPPEIALAHEVALVNMEEFLHGLQFLRGASLAGFADGEVDVAAYMLRNGIPMTESFLARYDRGFFINGQEGIDDSLSSRPAIRRGTFVNVQRSDGAVESDWQIIGFNPQTGDAIVRNYSARIEKQIPKPELAALNEHGIYPFNSCGSFEEVFTTIDRLVKIYGTTTVYEAQQLKKLVNRVRSNNADISVIPRSGGLRLRVAEFLKIDSAATDQVRTMELK